MKLPEAFKDRMQKMLGEEYEDFEKSYEKERAQGLRVNLLKGTPEELKRVFQLRPVPWAEEGFYYDEEERPGRHPYHEAGAYYIQEPSAMAVVTFLDPRPGDKVLDLCAAPGGKSSHIASRLGGEGFLLSNEIHPARAKILSRNMERMGVRNAVVTNEDPARLLGYFPEFFDKIVVDAPCSGEGMFRKDEEAVRQWSPGNVTLCAERQREILESAAGMLKAGGRLVYSTCTFSPEENEQTVERFLERHPEFSAEETPPVPGLHSGEPKWTKNGCEAVKNTVRIWPHRAEGEGHFIAVLRKGGEATERKRKMPPYLKDKKLLAGYADFCGQTFARPELWTEQKTFYLFGEQLYLLPPEMVDFDRLRVLRPGLQLGSFKKNRFEPSHALALALREEDVTLAVSFPPDSEEMAAYLRGEAVSGPALSEAVLSGQSGAALSGAVLPGQSGAALSGQSGASLSGQSGPREKGWALVLAGRYSVGWGKLSGGLLKNHYPKGLRK